MRPLVVLVAGLTLFKVALFVSVLSLIRFSPADPGDLDESPDKDGPLSPTGWDAMGAPLYPHQLP